MWCWFSEKWKSLSLEIFIQESSQKATKFHWKKGDIFLKGNTEYLNMSNFQILMVNIDENLKTNVSWAFFIKLIFLSSNGCCNKLPQTWWLKRAHIYSHRVPEIEVPNQFHWAEMKVLARPCSP